MSATELRLQYGRTFRGFARNHRIKAYGVVGSVVMQAAGAIAAGIAALTYLSTPWSTIAVAICALLIGTRMRALNNIVHECSHNTFAELRDDNRFLGSLSASLVLGCYSDYRDEHLTHHAHLGDYEHDMDLHGIKDLRLHDPLTPRTILRHAITPLIGRHLPYYLNLNLSGRDGGWFLALKVALIVGTLGLLAVAPLTVLTLVVVPYALVYSAINYWTDCLDHAGLIEEGDDLSTSRNVLAPWILRRIFFPRNDCYHLVHHLFPQVPSDHLREAHETLLANPIYSAQPNAAPQGTDLAGPAPVAA